jgi:hypothetical protein
MTKLTAMSFTMPDVGGADRIVKSPTLRNNPFLALIGPRRVRAMLAGEGKIAVSWRCAWRG